MMGCNKNTTGKAEKELNRLSKGKDTINAIRKEYELKPLKDEVANMRFTKE